MIENQKIRPAKVIGPLGEPLTLETLPLADYQAANGLFSEDIYEAIDLMACVNGRTSEGGPAPRAVRKQIALVREFLAAAAQ